MYTNMYNETVKDQIDVKEKKKHKCQEYLQFNF